MPKSSKVTISPSQALLLLIDKYRDYPREVRELKKLYLTGAHTQQDFKFIQHMLKDELLNDYHVSFRSETINEDPTRRYFETHLAYHSLLHGLEQISYDKLQQHQSQLEKSLPEKIRKKIEHVLKGEFVGGDNNLFKEYADYISKITKKELFPELNQESREKMLLLVKSSFLGVINAQNNKMPIDIYGTGLYSERNKGKVLVNDQQSTRNQNLGLLKGHMPVALNDIARSPQEIPYLKPSDQSSYVENALWVRDNFSKMVHPFSNSISGTMLCQLRSHAFLRNKGKGVFTESAKEMADYSKLMVAAMLFNSGGHTLHEFTAPLTLADVRAEFRDIPKFSDINMQSMFLDGNERAFDAALESAVSYNATQILRTQIHNVITSGQAPANKATLVMKTNQESTKLQEKLEDRAKNYSDNVSKQWFSSFRSGVKKADLINEKLRVVLNKLQQNDFNGAQKTIKELKTEVEQRFGKKNLWGQTSESYKVILNMEQDLKLTKKSVQSFKDKIQKMKEAPSITEESSVPSYK